MDDKKLEKYVSIKPIPRSGEIYFNPEPISREEKYVNEKPISKEESIPSIPDVSFFEELPDGCQINEFGEIIRGEGKSR